MPTVKNSQFETFEDGILEICETEERAIVSTKMQQIRYGKRTVGVNRFWSAKTAGNEVNKLISIPLSVMRVNSVDIHDVVILNNEQGQYQIIQTQEKYDKEPPALYLSLEKLVHPFKDRRKV